ncbi:hypothetical protein PV350_23590 [Streptomyces sp. PA03-6a]|nr:hypothetical protein [Streptomyces sp. PA03-6a]
MTKTRKIPEAPETAKVYVLFDRPDINGREKVVYVGVTTEDSAEERSRRHWHQRNQVDRLVRNPEMARWLQTFDEPPKAKLIGEFPYAHRHTVEAAATLAYRQAGHRLFNRRVGMAFTPETRARMSEARRRYLARQRGETA